MRKITKQVYTAFNENRNYKNSNTQVKIESDGPAIYLHGNCIVKKHNRYGICISLGGYRYTLTTRERLSPFVSLGSKNFIPYLYDEVEPKEWDGSWYSLNLKRTVNL